MCGGVVLSWILETLLLSGDPFKRARRGADTARRAADRITVVLCKVRVKSRGYGTAK